jgi:mRNA-degrading endonuclease RelE of RelBE toxin-antitoxin system
LPYSKKHHKMKMNWKVYFSRNAAKQAKSLNKKALSILDLLINDLQENGPFPGADWPNYGKLKGQKTDWRHCHLIKGRPTYVCCWEVIDKELKLIEVNYVGTHEKAPY